MSCQVSFTVLLCMINTCDKHLYICPHGMEIAVWGCCVDITCDKTFVSFIAFVTFTVQLIIKLKLFVVSVAVVKLKKV